MRSTVELLEQYLKGLPPNEAESPLAAAAYRLAEGLDDPRNKLTSRSIAAKAFQDILHELRELAPAPEMKDRLDELSSRRSRRRSRAG